MKRLFKSDIAKSGPATAAPTPPNSPENSKISAAPPNFVSLANLFWNNEAMSKLMKEDEERKAKERAIMEENECRRRAQEGKKAMSDGEKIRALDIVRHWQG